MASGRSVEFSEEDLDTAARVQAGLIVGPLFDGVVASFVAIVRQQPSRPFARALARHVFGAMIDRLAAARDEVLAELADPETAAHTFLGTPNGTGCIAVAGCTLPREQHPAPCRRCDGEGEIANSERGEPWVQWKNLPPGSDVAVRAGIVKPIPCPDCAGTGKRKVAP